VKYCTIGVRERPDSTVLRLTVYLFLCIAIDSAAYAATSITPSPGAGSLGTQVLPPTNRVYGITGGKTVGTNLFHSFGQFNVATGDTAQFQTPNLTANPSISNILGRVTGGNPSAIFGTIDSATYYPAANLFLMNPAGFLFGQNASVNVGGMFHVTTADYLKLADGNLFKATPDVAADALLTSFPVAAYGFLGSNPAAIAIEGSQLTVATGTGLSLVGGNRRFNYTNPDTGETGSVPDGVTMTGGRLSAPDGQINIVSVASAGEISATDFLPTLGMTMGPIALSQGASVDVSGDGGGVIRIRGGQLTIDNASLMANSTVGTIAPGTAISVNIQGDISLSHQGQMGTTTQGGGFGGDIEISAANVHLSEGSALFTLGSGAGKSGDIRLSLSGDLSLAGAGDIGISGVITSDGFGSGSITISSNSMTVTDLGTVATRTSGSGKTGNITIDTNTLNITGGGVIQTLSSSDTNPTGNIKIQATDSLTITGTGDITSTSAISNQNEVGGTGTISIETGRLNLSNQARIFNLTFFDSDPATASIPKIAITADSAITLSGGSRIDVTGFVSDTGSLKLSAGNLTMSGLSLITTLANGGASGPILMNVQNLTVSEGSQILSSSGQGVGRGGDIAVNATGSVLVTGQGTDPFGQTFKSAIESNTVAGFADPSFTGNAGNISITANSIEVSHGARINSSSQGYALGNAGNIELTAPTININGGTVSTSTEFSGSAGGITLQADSVTLSNGGQLTSSSITRQTPFFEGEIIPPATGAAGNITINAGNQFAMISSSVNTEATQSSGGAIKITTNPDGTVQLNNSTISASVLDGTGGGGSVNIDPQYVILQNNSHITANAVFGPGGNVFITTNLLLPDATSTISASSQFGQQGTVTIQSPVSPASGRINPLGQKPLLAVSMFNQRCAALAAGTFSSFTVAGRETLPAQPASWLSTPLALSVPEAENRAVKEAESSASDVTPLLSLRQIAPPGFLTQGFAVESSGCDS
jgi:filamentous hemagglutinin family protein